MERARSARGTERRHRQVEEGDSGHGFDHLPPFRVSLADKIWLRVLMRLTIRLSQLPNLASTVMPTFKHLLSSRQLPSEIIVKLTAIAIGTHWHARQSAGVVPTADTTNGSDVHSKRRREAEETAIDFLLEIATVMLEVSAREVQESSSAGESALLDDEQVDPLPLMISAVFRRILPSLRILSKWLKLHLEYLSRLGSRPVITNFWTIYDSFIDGLGAVFPIERLPSLADRLEEDVDMRGFSPLSRGMTKARFDEERAAEHVEMHDVHPNEEQLMRIADLQVDAVLIAQAQVCLQLIVLPLARKADEPSGRRCESSDWARGGPDRPSSRVWQGEIRRAGLGLNGDGR